MISQASLFFESPLYHSLDTTGESLYYLLGTGKFDFYSSSLKENTTYRIADYKVHSGKSLGSIKENDLVEVFIECVRTNERLVFYFFVNPTMAIIIKIGQYPSLADLHISKIKEFDKVLSTEKLKEFTRAIGLAANGVGIGSFVYLRRIFEDLIEEARQKASKINGWDEDTFIKSRMSEKIGFLKDFLPEFLVEHKDLYSILSIGIHSLTEEDCLAYFETVKLGIELILEEKAEKLEKQKRLADAKGKISQLNLTLKKD